MFIRQKFVTNSSTTSFVAWGFEFERSKIDDYIKRENMSWEDMDNFWEDMSYNEWEVSIKKCGYSNRAFIIVSDSLREELREIDYLSFDQEIPEQWKTDLQEWCDKFGIPFNNPKWFLATVGC